MLGSKLKRHKDRFSCEISTTMNGKNIPIVGICLEWVVKKE